MEDQNGDVQELLRTVVNEVRLEIEGLRTMLNDHDALLADLHAELKASNHTAAALRTEVGTLKQSLKSQTAKAKKFWSQKCEQLLAHEAAIEEKDVIIATLHDEIHGGMKQWHSLSELEVSTDVSTPLLPVASPQSEVHGATQGRRGKAPPVDSYHGSDPEVHFDDWLPTLERAAQWNQWSDEERLLQLAGHLRGKAAREYALLSTDDKQSFGSAVQALCTHLDPSSCALAAQDFCNALQYDKESVSDYITRLKRSFQIAYGREQLSAETKEAFLFSQLQAGLKLSIMESPAVSESLSYKPLCVAAKQEEKRLSDLRRRKQLDKQARNYEVRYPSNSRQVSQSTSGVSTEQFMVRPSRDCYICGSPYHIAKQCKQRKTESSSENKNKINNQTSTDSKNQRLV